MPQDEKTRETVKNAIGRRDFLLGLSLAPLTPTTSFNVKKEVQQNIIRKKISDKIRIGIIGFGFRGEQLARSLKFAHPDWIKAVRRFCEVVEQRQEAFKVFRQVE